MSTASFSPMMAGVGYINEVFRVPSFPIFVLILWKESPDWLTMLSSDVLYTVLE